MQMVGIIGGSGFIGSYVTRRFLDEGYRVRVSATDISRKDKYAHLLDLPGADRLEIVPLNTQDVGALADFVEGCSILVHGGTPFVLDVKDPQADMFDPTIKGTENFLRVVKDTGGVTKVVFIASVAAYNAAFPFPNEHQPPDHVYTENDTPFVLDDHLPYAQAKHHADQAVRTFVNDNPGLAFEVVSVFPTLVVGKALSGRDDSTSVGIQHLFKHRLAPTPLVEMMLTQDVPFALVDVNDVAECVFKAATTPGLHGRNYLLSSETWRISDISLMLNGQPPAGTPRTVYSSALATRDLGVQFTPPRVPLAQYGG
ncbi:aldehyde reductase [soil metagenome]